MSVGLRRMTQIRETYPTALFYFSQSENALIVVYMLRPDGTIKAVYGELLETGFRSECEEVSPATFDEYLRLSSVSGGYHLPGVVEDSPWTLGRRSLSKGSHVLLHVHGNVSEDSVRSMSVVSVNRVNKTVETRSAECRGELRGCVPALRQWYNLYCVKQCVKSLLPG
jgi:hypothetical protein